MDTKLQMIFAEKDMSCIQSMITIAQATCKPASTILQSKLKEHLRGQFSVEKILSTLEPTGLSEHDILNNSCVFQRINCVFHMKHLKLTNAHSKEVYDYRSGIRKPQKYFSGYRRPAPGLQSLSRSC
ncbi:hypothetical protein BSL78_02374 [Apostichopus japonicus]|uniref:Uncharacterized protein n=1 Tax=Stichopus japonicus TaxID=307972 RepID=A0A2G8LKD8_STIJA|nr:hypothetical protein BSL78_02374 [Apostichopus japonicus]